MLLAKVVLFGILIVMSAKGHPRLEPNVMPLHYNITLLPVMTGNDVRLCGHVYLDIEATKTTNLIRFHGQDLDIYQVTYGSFKSPLEDVEELCFNRLTKRSNKDPMIKAISHDSVLHEWTILLYKSMIQGEQYRIGILYTAKVNEKSNGFYRIKATNPATCCESWMGVTQMQAAHARKVFPCLDEPGYKANFSVTVGHQMDVQAVSNMPEREVNPMSITDGWTWTVFDSTPPMPTYLLAVVITDLDYVLMVYKSAVDGSKIRLRYWSRKDDFHLLNQTMTVTPKLLAYLERTVMQPYSLPKLDFMPIPKSGLSFAAMENWGLIVFSEDVLVHDETKDSARDASFDVQIIAHELAHQFFGNLVTSDWWNELWFNEGSCVLIDSLSIASVLPEHEWHSNSIWTENFHKAMLMDEVMNTRYVSQPVTTMEEVEKLGSDIDYHKSAALIRMVRNFLGPQTFQAGLANYFKLYRFKNANSDQLWDVLNEEFYRHKERFGRPIDVKKVMDSWTKQNNYPIIHCERIIQDGRPSRRIRLWQQPFPGKSENASARWWIPIALTEASRADFSSSGTLPRLWLTPERPSLEVSVPLPKDGDDGQKANWIIVNGQMTGFYRVQYDEHNYRILSEQLLANYSVIPDVTRRQLVSDAFTLAEADLVDYEAGPLQLIKYLKVVNDEFVRSTVFFHFKRMKELSTKYGQIYDDYFKLLSKSPAENSNRNRAAEDLVATLSKTRCDVDENQCVGLARRLYGALLVGKPLSIDEKQIMLDEMEVIWCTAIRHGDQPEWDFAWKKSLDLKWVRQRSKILSALSCSSHPKRLKRLLTRVFHPSVEQYASETTAMLRGMAENSVGRSLVQRFLMANWKALNQFFGRASDAVELLMTASKYAKTDEDRQEMADFLSQQKDFAVSKTESTALLDNIQRNIHWVKNCSERVSSILSNLSSQF